MENSKAFCFSISSFIRKEWQRRHWIPSRKTNTSGYESGEKMLFLIATEEGVLRSPVHGEKPFPNSCCYGFKDCGAGSPEGCGTCNTGFSSVTTCFLGLRAGRWIVLSMTLLWGATPPSRDIFKCRLADKFPIAAVWRWAVSSCMNSDRIESAVHWSF